MKKIFIAVLFVVFCINVEAQVYGDDDAKGGGKRPSITKEEKDEFTGLSSKTTSVETLFDKSKFSMFVHGIKIENDIHLVVRFMPIANTPFIVKTDDRLYLKLDNESVVKLNPYKTTVACKGCGNNGTIVGSGRYGASVAFFLDSDNLQSLLKNKVVKISFRGDEFLTMEDELKDKRQSTIMKILTLLK